MELERFKGIGRPPYTPQAKVLVEAMPDLDEEDLLKWWVESQYVIGSAQITSYLLHKKNEK